MYTGNTATVTIKVIRNLEYMKNSAGLRTRIKNLVKKSPQKSISVTQLQVAISSSIPGITKLEIKAAIKEMIKINEEQKKAGRSIQYKIAPNKGGNSIRYTHGGETTKKGTGPYRDITGVIDGDSQAATKIFGAPHLNSYDVHAGKSVRGEWGRPDVIVSLYRGIGSSKPFEIHAIEFVHRGGFSASNVAQAYFGGSGADKCWLLFDYRDWPINSAQRVKNPNADRVKKFAEKLGVGLIYFRTLSQGGSWHVVLQAKPQSRNIEERKSLRSLFEGEENERRKLSKMVPVKKK